MSGIFLNYDDVRRLVKHLGERRPTGGTVTDAGSLLADGLNTPFSRLETKVWSKHPPMEPEGIELTLEIYEKLRALIISSDLTRLPQVKRLSAVAECFGWRADALMHSLKTTTKGRNQTLSDDKAFLDRFVGAVGQRKASAWKAVLEGGRGLYIVAGDIGSGASDIRLASVNLLGISLSERLDFSKGQGGWRNGTVYATAIRTPEDYRRSAILAESATVIATLCGVNIGETRSELGRLARESVSHAGIVRAILQTTLSHDGEAFRVAADIIKLENVPSSDEEFQRRTMKISELGSWAKRRGFAEMKPGVFEAPYGPVRIRLSIQNDGFMVSRVSEKGEVSITKGKHDDGHPLFLDQFDMVHGIGLFTRFYGDYRDGGPRPIWFSDELVAYMTQPECSDDTNEGTVAPSLQNKR